MKRETVPAIVATLSLVVLSTLPLHGQDAEASEEEPAWSAEVGFSLNSAGGNEQLTMLTSEVGLRHLETTSYEANVGARFRYGRSQGEEVAQNLRSDVSVDLWPQAGWSPFLFTTAENDPFKLLDVRLNGGSGVKRTFWSSEWEEVSLSGAVLYSYERLDVEPEADQEPVTQTARWSWRGRVRLEFGDGRRFEQVAYYQPAWDEFDDYLIEARTSGRWALTRSLAFTTTFTYERDSTPAPNVGPEDWTVAVGLSAATQW